jgi:threonine synthase
MVTLTLPDHVTELACVLCDYTTRDPWIWSCPECGPVGRMDVRYDPGPVAEMKSRLHRRARNQWRYREVLPIGPDAVLPPISVGWSPVSTSDRLARWLGVRSVVVKDDGRNPSASLKDRASAVGVVMALQAGSERIACASTGNAASSTACIAASMGLPATIFVPARAPAPKVAQLLVFGAQVVRVAADYDRTWDLCAEVTALKPWFNRNCAINPYLVEGKKTVALELAEQLGSRMPTWVAVSVGDGCTVAGVVKGLEEAAQAGLIDSVPRVLAVQAEGAAPLVAAAARGHFEPSEADTVADSICVGTPRNPHKALLAVERCDGGWIAVSDEAILEALVQVPRLSGVFGEPAGVAAAAGVKEAVAQGIISPNEDVALLVTGNGLKDTATARQVVGDPMDVEPEVEAVLAALEALG